MTTMWCLWHDAINPVTVDRFTKGTVWIEGGKSARYGKFSSYHETWEEAHNYLMKQAQEEVNSIRNELARANENLGRIIGMKPPVTPSEEA